MQFATSDSDSNKEEDWLRNELVSVSKPHMERFPEDIAVLLFLMTHEYR